MRAARSVPILTALLIVAGPAHAQKAALPVKYEVDAAHSEVGFTVGFMGLSVVRGAFSEFSGTIMLDETEPTRSTVSLLIAASSINTNAAMRDRHLKSPDFFDVDRFPYVTFRSSRVERAGNGFIVRGTLVMHGVSKEIAVAMRQVHRPTQDAWRNTRVTYEGGVRLSRRDFGILGTAFWNTEYDPGRMAVADTVNVELLVSGSIPNIARWNGPVGDSLLAALHSDTDQTLTRLRAAVAATPPDGLPRVGLQAIRQAGGKLLIEGHLADATRLYETAAELMPKVPQAKLLLGDAYVRAGRFADARAQFQAAHQADSLNTEANEWLRALPR